CSERICAETTSSAAACSWSPRMTVRTRLAATAAESTEPIANPPKNDRWVGLKRLRIEATRDDGGVSDASTRLRRYAGANSFSAAPAMASRITRNEASFSAQAEQADT